VKKPSFIEGEGRVSGGNPLTLAGEARVSRENSLPWWEREG